jgi:hypothetical protein
MNWLHDLADLFGAAFLTNSIPHLVSGLMGRPFQSPFAHPPGEGFSSSTVNVLWGFLNLALAYGLMARAGAFDLGSIEAVAAAAVGGLLMALLLARRFGRFNGGNSPGEA